MAMNNKRNDQFGTYGRDVLAATAIVMCAFTFAWALPFIGSLLGVC